MDEFGGFPAVGDAVSPRRGRKHAHENGRKHARQIGRTHGRKHGRQHVVLGIAIATAIAVALVPGVSRAAWPAAKKPVVFVTGLFETASLDATLTGRLQRDGYPVYVYELPGLGTGDIHTAALGLAAFVGSVQAMTGAPTVDIVDHSEGALVARDYVQFGGGAARVDKLVSLAGVHKGTVMAGLFTLVGFGNCVGIVACQQMVVGSPFLTKLNAGDTSVGDVRYWNIETRYDELVIPYTNAFMNTAHGNIVNATIQDQCPWKFVEHAGLLFDGTAYSGVRQALQGSTQLRFDCFAF